MNRNVVFIRFDFYFKVGIMQKVHLEKGQGLLEYALILVLIGVVVAAVVTFIGPAIGNIFSTIVEVF